MRKWFGLHSRRAFGRAMHERISVSDRSCWLRGGQLDGGMDRAEEAVVCIQERREGAGPRGVSVGPYFPYIPDKAPAWLRLQLSASARLSVL